MQPPNVLPKLVVSKFLQHFQAMMGQFGLYQHATSRVPLLSEGYCTDDNARAVNMLIGLKSLVSSTSDKQLIETLLERCWTFIKEAQIQPGKFLNFRAASGEWLPTDQSEDMYARVIKAAGAMADSTNTKHATEATNILKSLYKRAQSFIAIRAQAETVIALAQLQVTQPSTEQVNSLALLQLKKIMGFWKKESSPDWSWFEATATYANAIIPASLLAGLKFRNDAEVTQALHASAKFLIQTTIKNNIFIPIGSRGWYVKGSIPSVDNQQAIEAALMFDFLIQYQAQFPDRVTGSEVIAPYMWFFGHNTGKTILAQPEVGSCLDGLFTDMPNQNQGAESMLAYQWAEICARKAPASIQQEITQALAKPL